MDLNDIKSEMEKKGIDFVSAGKLGCYHQVVFNNINVLLSLGQVRHGKQYMYIYLYNKMDVDLQTLHVPLCDLLSELERLSFITQDEAVMMRVARKKEIIQYKRFQ